MLQLTAVNLRSKSSMRYILSIQLQSKGGHCQFNLIPTFLILAELGILNGNSGGGGISEVWVRAFKV